MILPALNARRVRSLVGSFLLIALLPMAIASDALQSNALPDRSLAKYPQLRINGTRSVAIAGKPTPPARISIVAPTATAAKNSAVFNVQVLSPLAAKFPVTLRYQLRQEAGSEIERSGFDMQGPTARIAVAPGRQGKYLLFVTAQIHTDEGPVTVSKTFPFKIGTSSTPLPVNGTLLQTEGGEWLVSMSSLSTASTSGKSNSEHNKPQTADR